MSVTGRLMAGLRAFREAYMVAGMEGFDTPAFSQMYDFEGADARATRYDVLWAYYQGNVYRDLHKWSRKLKAEYGLYIHIRDIYNPANRICNFHQTHIWGGYIDVGAGDASEIPSALPIEDTASDSVREAIARIWEWSRWQVTKDIITLYGSVFGDVFVRVTDLPERKMVYLERIHPAWLIDVRKNPLDEIEYYEMTYVRRDPDNPDRNVQYSETAELTDSGVTYQTFKDNKPYAWNGSSDTWAVPYPFLPIVHIKHNDVGLDWGWSELFPKLSTFRELDDQASKLGDQVRKMVDSPWLFTGVKPGKTGGTITIEGLGTENPTEKEVERDETPILYAHEPGARAWPLVSELDIEAALSHIKEIALEVERSYPELRTGGGMGGGRSREVASGRALLIARGEAEDKIEQRRVNYDEKLVKIHRMAMAIASEAGYEGFDGFTFESWDGKDTDHRIKALRSVFRPHPTETLDQDRQLWTNAHLAQNVGVPLDIFLRDNEWEEERIKEIINSEMYKLHIETLALPTQQVEGGGGDEGDPEQGDRGDTSGRGPISGGIDFDLATRKKTEG